MNTEFSLCHPLKLGGFHHFGQMMDHTSAWVTMRLRDNWAQFAIVSMGIASIYWESCPPKISVIRLNRISSGQRPSRTDITMPWCLKLTYLPKPIAMWMRTQAGSWKIEGKSVEPETWLNRWIAKLFTLQFAWSLLKCLKYPPCIPQSARLFLPADTHIFSPELRLLRTLWPSPCHPISPLWQSTSFLRHKVALATRERNGFFETNPTSNFMCNSSTTFAIPIEPTHKRNVQSNTRFPNRICPI